MSKLEEPEELNRSFVEALSKLYPSPVQALNL
ncbi:Protein of unknown function [Pyronema omphalodes CBS 100304]|uniref:Uncharacterized protein n=1 Tax=Pyronema omphalodes (strain CBS 100304) TaxID=1076935 RepID=U4LCH1_PYROM|nr:Protein of unknown function [Pyronema omphalodes CBS 100304]